MELPKTLNLYDYFKEKKTLLTWYAKHPNRLGSLPSILPRNFAFGSAT